MKNKQLLSTMVFASLVAVFFGGVAPMLRKNQSRSWQK